MEQQMMEKYADLVVRVGVNIQADQTLVVTSPIDCAPFVRLLAERAYQANAREVVINWRDPLSAKVRFLLGRDELFDEFPDWQKDFYMHYLRLGAAFLSVSGDDPELLQEVKPDRIMKAQKVRSLALKEYRDSLMANENVWCVVSLPTPAWAGKVFPYLPEEQALAKLGQYIGTAVRLDRADPIEAWKSHREHLNRRIDFLNNCHFRLLRFTNTRGTNLTIELPAEHVWIGGVERSTGGIEFIPNMPTEEVYTVPAKTGVNGIAVSSKPLNYNGRLIENFTLTFANGKVIKWQAEKGQETLTELLASDEGAAFLGEVALVPHDSPVSMADIVFYNTLFDENASCHLALGKAYPDCLADGRNKTQDELARLGVNDSMVHEDFMIGTADMNITGITYSGEEIPVFRYGTFACV